MGQSILRPLSLVSSVCIDCGSWLFVGCLHLLWVHLYVSVEVAVKDASSSHAAIRSDKYPTKSFLTQQC